MIATLGRLGLALLVSFISTASAQNQLPRVLNVEGKVLDIVGVSRGVEGVLQDLGAKVVGQEIVIELSADVLFDFDKSDLKPAAVDALTKVVEVLKGMPNSPATVDGHTDGRGNADYNYKLSEPPPNSVTDSLANQGRIPPSPLPPTASA